MLSPTATIPLGIGGKSARSSTSLETREHPAPRAPHEPDEPEAYDHRDAVASELLKGVNGWRWRARARAMKECGRGAIQVRCNGCSTAYLVPYRCGARTCPTCARKSSAGIAARIEARVVAHERLMQGQVWDGNGASLNRQWKHLVLTCPASRDVARRFDPAILRASVRQVRKSFASFWRMTSWGAQVRDPLTSRKRSRRDTSYILAEEISPRGMVHLHVLVFGEYVLQSELQELWSEALGKKAIVHVSAIRGGAAGIAEGLREVLKYATKGEKKARSNARRAAAVELAFRHLKRVSVGGALRNIRVRPSDSNAEDTQPEDLHASHEMRCLVCGEAGNWHWSGRVDRGVVMRNGGYGLLAEAPPTVSGEAS